MKIITVSFFLATVVSAENALAEIPVCELKPIASDFTDPAISIRGAFSVVFFGAFASGGEPSENCILRVTGTGKPNPRSFIEERYHRLSMLDHTVALKSVAFLPTDKGQTKAQKLTFYSMGFSGLQPLNLLLSVESLSASEFKLIVEYQTDTGVQPLAVHYVSNLTDASVSVHWTAGETLLVSVAGYSYSVPGQVTPRTARFGSLKEASVVQGSTIAFNVSSTCKDVSGQILTNCARQP